MKVPAELDAITDKVLAYNPDAPKGPLKAIAGAPDSPLVVSDIEIDCYVLEDETRVLSQGSFLRGIGRARTPVQSARWRCRQPPRISGRKEPFSLYFQGLSNVVNSGCVSGSIEGAGSAWLPRRTASASLRGLPESARSRSTSPVTAAHRRASRNSNPRTCHGRNHRPSRRGDRLPAHS